MISNPISKLISNKKLLKIGLPIAISSLLILGGGYYARSLFDKTAPEIELVGINDDGYCSDVCPCKLSINDNCGLKNVEIFLDEKMVFSSGDLHAAQFEHAWSLDTKTLIDGKHVLKITARDSSRRKNQAIRQIAFFVDNASLQTTLLSDSRQFSVFPGRVLHVRVQTSKEIKSALLKTNFPEDAREYAGVAKSAGCAIYDFFVPVKCDETPGEYMFRITVDDNVGHQTVIEHKFRVEPFEFKKQVLVLDPEKIKTEASLGLPIAHFEAQMELLAKKSPASKLWRGPFDIPLESQGISTEFGLIRVTQSRGKYRHAALDLRAVPRSVIWASNDGVVVLKDRYEHGGNSIVIDHGCGLLSLFFHLDSFADVSVGDRVKKGQPIGTVGKTGHANGYHLHWEMRLNNISVDPMQWIDSSFDA